MPPESTPTAISATYRLQLNKDFTFQHAADLLAYLSELGITHVYASPILSSRRGSTHSYDVIDPTRLNPELGTEADFAAFRDKLHALGMGLLLDIVPNHMSASSEDFWWMDVLENGPESAYASHFDIDWHPPLRTLDGKILLPVLGGPFGEVLERQELKLVPDDGKLIVRYFESLFPLAPKTYRRVLKHRIDQLKAVLGEDSPVFQEYSGIVAAFSALSDRDTEKSAATGNQRLPFETLRERLRQLISTSAYVQTFLQQNVKDFNGEPGNPASFSLLERLLDEQNYVLAYWQNVNVEINYRRFFTINDLVGIRVEDPLVFEATHALVARLVEQGAVAAVRIDHIDGLRDPLGYLNRLRERIATTASTGGSTRHPIFVEKILARSEHLPANWPIDGTTGYEFLNTLNCFFVDPRGAEQLEQIYAKFLGREPNYDDTLYQKKRLVMATLLAVEMRSLGHHLELLAADDRYARDLPLPELTQALIETTAHLRVYRTYARNLDPAPRDQARIEQALEDARSRRPQLNPACFRFLGDVLLLRNQPHLLPGQKEDRLTFLMRWQQITGPITAKAFEDTFLYIFQPLTSLNEVGGDPRPSTAPLVDFSKFIRERSRHWPHSMNATTTHDTKRSEDVRARINVLSELPGEWETYLNRWSEQNAPRRKMIQGHPVPDRNEEIFLYQTLLGMWPLEAGGLTTLVERLQAYAIKATREAMVHTRWTKPNLPHEQALRSFIGAILKTGAKNLFLSDFSLFQKRLAYYGMVNGLSQTLLKIVSPGFPDFYQGSELWDLRLVDPDNRQPVDFTVRQNLLHSLTQADQDDAASLLEDLLQNWHDARIKLFLIWKALNFRRHHTELFTQGDFVSLKAKGPRKENVTAFLRRYKRDSTLIVIPRWLARSTDSPDAARKEGFWADTQIVTPAASSPRWRNILTDEEVTSARNKGERTLNVSQILRRFPVALLTGVPAKPGPPSRKKRSSPRR
jgi:(1->4)-alpha-D-glucan 1-alpha-D-glucosylmutase